MTPARISEIETLVRDSDRLSPEAKAELLKDLAELKDAAGQFPERNAAPETNEREGESVNPAWRELSASVEGLEASHPQLTSLANRIAVVLSNMGI